MGQRSQIYVRASGQLIVANYYQWNYAERMISRARYGIEYIDSVKDYSDWIFLRDVNVEQWQSSAQKCKGEGLSCKALFGNGIEMNRSAMDLLGTAQQRLCEG